MSVTYASFVARFPQFAETSRAVVEACLQEATAFVDPTVWGALADSGIVHWAAHLIECSPYGRTARLNQWDNSTSYSAIFYELRSSVAPRVLVT